jgi:hypothetical protein
MKKNSSKVPNKQQNKYIFASWPSGIGRKRPMEDSNSSDSGCQMKSQLVHFTRRIICRLSPIVLIDDLAWHAPTNRLQLGFNLASERYQ